MKPRSLQWHLLVRILALIGLVWVLAAALVWRDARHEIDELLDAHLAQSAALLIARQTHHGRIEEDDDETFDAAISHRYARHVAFQIWHDGRLVLHSPNAAGERWTLLEEGFETLRRDRHPWRLFATRTANGELQVYVAEEIDSRRDILVALLRSLLWPMLMTLPLMALSVWWSVRRGLAPLRALRDHLAGRAPDALAPVELGGRMPTELQAPVDALNQLFGRIAGLLDSERRFTADAAHELRTPIAAIRTQAQVALGATDELERRHALQATISGCDRASHLVQQLLTLARLESQGGAAAPAPASDLAATARRVIGELVPAALARQQSVELDAPEHCVVPASDTLSGVLLRNLVDNALRYSPAGATVQVRVVETLTAVTLEVQDSGPGLSDADLARLGERFFRVLGTEASGSGLGWSIVRRIAAAQGAQVEAARSTALGGLAVSVRWAR